MGRKERISVVQTVRARWTAGKTTDYTHIKGTNKQNKQNLLEYAAELGEIIRIGVVGGKTQYGPMEAVKKYKPIASEEGQYKHLLDSLKAAKPQPVEIHNLELMTEISREEYEDLKALNPERVHPQNKQIMIVSRMIAYGGANPYSYDVTAKVSTTGTVEIKTKLSQHPFQLREEGDIYDIANQMGEWRRILIERGMTASLPMPGDWILQKVDINKNLRLRDDDNAPKMVTFLSMKKVYTAFTAYVKYMEDEKQWELRIEENRTLTDNPTFVEACRDIIHQEAVEPLESRFAEAINPTSRKSTTS